MDQTHHTRRRLLFHILPLLLLKVHLSSIVASVGKASPVNVSTHSNIGVTARSSTNEITLIEFGAVGAYVDLYINGRFTRRSLPSTTSHVTTLLPAASTIALRVFGAGSGALYMTVRGRGNLLSSAMPQLFHALPHRAMPVSSLAWPTTSYDSVACSWPLARPATALTTPMISNTAPLWAVRARVGETILVRNVARGCGSSTLSISTTSTTTTTADVNNEEMEEVQFDMRAKPDRNAVALAAGFVRRLRKVLYATDLTRAVQMIALSRVKSVQSKRAILLKSSLFNSQPLLRQGVNGTERLLTGTPMATAVKTDCFAEKCGTEVEVMSEAKLRKAVVTTAVNRLRKRASFDDVYDLDEVLVTKEAEPFMYAVFVPFRQLYIEEFRR